MLNLRRIKIPESKSIANRLLILSSFEKEASLPCFRNSCEDIEDLKQALLSFQKGEKSFQVRSGATSFRFLLARLSREKGSFRIFASPRLLSRPHDGLKEALLALGVKTDWKRDCCHVDSQGWHSPSHNILGVDGKKSSQFASALLLSSVNLPFPLRLRVREFQGSLPYFDMSLALLKKGGISYTVMQKERSSWDECDEQEKNKMERLSTETEIEINEDQKWKSHSFECEADMSSAFSVTAVALAKGEPLILEALPRSDLQADVVFIDILKKMKIPIHEIARKDGLRDLRVIGTKDIIPIKEKQKPWKAIEVNLSKSPDLFPVLGALSALLPSSEVFSFLGLENLKYKESDRLKKTIELIEKAGAKAQWETDTLKVQGPVKDHFCFTFDPDQDHRMAMAAAVLIAHGLKIQLKFPEVVRKSFPHFWEVVGLNPSC